MISPANDAGPSCELVPPRLEAPSRGWVLPVAFGVLGVAAVALYCFDPGHSPFYPVCMFHQTTGLLCPGCGGLRAVHQLLHGHVAAAIHFNALFVLTLPLVAWVAIRAGMRKLKHQPEAPLIRPAWLWWALAVLVVFGVLRNLPFAQAAWLAP